jgi:hypothetical protein
MTWIGLFFLIVLFVLFRSSRKRVVMETEISVNSPRLKSLLAGWSAALLVNGLALLFALEGLARIVRGSATHGGVITLTIAIIVAGPVTFVYVALERQIAKLLREHGDEEPSLAIAQSAYRSRLSSGALTVAVLSLIVAAYSVLQIAVPKVYNGGHSSASAVQTLIVAVGLSLYAVWVFRIARSGTGGPLDWFRGR